MINWWAYNDAPPVSYIVAAFGLTAVSVVIWGVPSTAMIFRGNFMWLNNLLDREIIPYEPTFLVFYMQYIVSNYGFLYHVLTSVIAL